MPLRLVWRVLGANPALIIALVCVLLLALFIFFKLMPAYTREGRKVQDHIEGLRQYLGVAERDDLARMKAPEMTPTEFARMLPYALALDVEKTWADRFAAVLGTAAVAAAVSSYYAGDTSSWGSNSIDGRPIPSAHSTARSAQRRLLPDQNRAVAVAVAEVGVAGVAAAEEVVGAALPHPTVIRLALPPAAAVLTLTTRSTSRRSMANGGSPGAKPWMLTIGPSRAAILRAMSMRSCGEP